jgi:SpoIID/LytB domain protein
LRDSKRIITFILVLVLAVAMLIGTGPAYAAAYYTDVRVLLSVDGNKSVDIELIGEYYLNEDPSFEFESRELTISMVGSRPLLTSGGNTFTASSITLMSGDYDGTSSYIRLTNSRYGVSTYLGNMTFDISGGDIRVINTLPIEHYLYGVVPYEMSNTFPIESLKAQAVCARGYAVANCSKYRLRPYDILDTSADQVYHGYASKYTRAIAAVDETFGQILTYDGDIIQAYYAASNGGQTELTGNVWSSNLPYYVQRDDIYDIENPHSLEEKSFVPAQFSEQTIALMDPLVLIMLQQGADKAAGAQVTLLGTVRIKAHSAIYDPPSRLYTQADVTLMVAAGDGEQGQVTFTISLDDLVETDDNPDGIFNTGKRTLRLRSAQPGVLTTDGNEYDGWFITNRRYGHGVGMSQRGAEQRAFFGQTYSQILDFYYADTAIRSIGSFETAPTLSSETYTISAVGVSGIAPGTASDELLDGISTTEGGIIVISSTGTEKTNSLLKTGDFVRTVYGESDSYFDLPVLIFGDIDGNGKITQGDLDTLSAHLLNTNRLTGVYLNAADVNHDNAVDSLDILLLLKHIQGNFSIEQ